MRILYAGRLNPAATSLARMRGLVELGHLVMPLDYDSHIFFRNKISCSFHIYFLWGPGIKSLNQELIRKAREGKPDLVWIDRGVYFWPKTLLTVKQDTKALLVHHNTDDIIFQKHYFRNYYKALDIYDAHFTSNLHNIQELGTMTKSYVGYNELGYDDTLFRPLQLNDNDKWLESEIFFIGHWEENTEKYIKLLVEAGLPVTVRGQKWLKVTKNRLPKGVVKSGPVYLEDYVKAINAGKIGLGIVSKWNRNHTSPRLFEIPACGTMLLAPRNEVVEKLFEDGKGVVFFKDSNELIEKAKYYLNHPEERKAIAAAGRQRCLANKWSWKDRVVEVLEELKDRSLLRE